MPTISIVIPCFNNEGQLRKTVSEIETIAKAWRDSGISTELILVDDASSDNTWNIIKDLKKTPYISVIGLRLAENVGAYQAIVPGLELAKGDAVIVMAADGDDPPGLLRELVKEWQQGAKLVQAVRSVAGNALSSLFYGTLGLLSLRNIPAHGSDFMLADRSVVIAALQHRFFDGNTLVQLYQHAEKATQIPYAKGKRPSNGWTFRKKLHLFIASTQTAVGWKTRGSAPIIAEQC